MEVQPGKQAVPANGYQFLSRKPSAETEWWYYHGHLDSENRRFGFHLAFFRRCTKRDRIGKLIPLKLFGSTIHYSHFSITETCQGRYHFDHQCSFEKKPWGETDHYHLEHHGWSVCERGEAHIIKVETEQLKLDLLVTPSKPLVSHGDNGQIIKANGQPTYHFSYPRMSAEGEIAIEGDNYSVSGSAWMDREYGTWSLCDEFQGWDWCGIQLDNGCELMVYSVLDRLQKPNPHSRISFIDQHGAVTSFSNSEFKLLAIGDWSSPYSATSYPMGWILKIPALDLEVELTPALRCQEVVTTGTTDVVYWEGQATVQGTMFNRPVTGSAYVELVGYDRSHERPSLLTYALHRANYLLRRQTRTNVEECQILG